MPCHSSSPKPLPPRSSDSTPPLCAEPAPTETTGLSASEGLVYLRLARTGRESLVDQACAKRTDFELRRGRSPYLPEQMILVSAYLQGMKSVG